MGGATSKFDENDWEKADGELVDQDYTLDGAPPTGRYLTYNFVKKGINQREFDLTDADQNLLYTTRQVPGTIACFDVMGRGIDDYLLRVFPDISRRYWTIYRYDKPAFKGQLHDQQATDKVTVDRLANADIKPEQDSFRTPKLFKVGCVVVSWSRYMAVVTQYGPPSEQSIKDYEEEIKKQEAEDAAQQEQEKASKTETEPFPQKATTIEEQNDQIQQSKSMPDMQSPPKDPDEAASATTIPKSNSSVEASFKPAADAVSESLRRTRTWFRQQSKSIKEKSKAYLPAKKRKLLVDPREGVLDFDRPLLLCQEIYTRLIGNHQTSVVSKKTVLDLLRQDEEQHNEEKGNRDRTESSETTGDEGVEMILQAQEALEAVELDDSTSSDNDDTTKKEKQPLVGYLIWEHTLTSVNKMKIHVAKGSDLALHVVLAIIVNQVRYERNALAMTI